MKARHVVFVLAVCFLGIAVCVAQNSMMGTWKLSEAKSKFAPGARKNHTVKYEAAGENTKVTVDGMNADGQAVHTEWTGMFDGKDYPVTGDPGSDTRSYKKVNDRTAEFTEKKDGKPITEGRVTVSPDGKTRTVTTTTTDSKGKKMKNTAVYDKA